MYLFLGIIFLCAVGNVIATWLDKTRCTFFNGEDTLEKQVAKLEKRVHTMEDNCIMTNNSP